MRLASDARLALGLLTLSVLALCAFLLVGFGPLPSRALRSPAAEPPRAQPAAGTEFVDVTDAVGLAGWRHDLVHGVRSIADAVAPGLGLLDLDEDSDLDLVLLTGTSGPTGVAILLNDLVPEGRLRFRDATAECGIEWQGAAQGVCAGDVDADGDVDLYVTALGSNLLLLNTLADHGELGFVDATLDAGVAGGHWHWVEADKYDLRTLPGAPPPGLGEGHSVPEFSTGASFGDFDADGDLDLYVANYVAWFEQRHARAPAPERTSEERLEPVKFQPQFFEPLPDRLLLNQGSDDDLYFLDVSRAARVDDAEGRGMGCVFMRIDGDDYPDLYLANDTSENVFFHNVAIGADDPAGIRRCFADETAEFGLFDLASGMGIARGDVDGDADLDLLTTNWRNQAATLFLFRREERLAQDGTTSLEPVFDSRADAAGLFKPTERHVGWGCVFFDYDNDGDQDLFVGNGFTSPRQGALACAPEAPLLFRNAGGGRFAEVTASAGAALQRVYSARGVVAGDLDRDGDLDLVLAQNQGPVVCLENRLPAGGFQSLSVAVRIGRLRRSEAEAVPDADPPRDRVRGDAVNVVVIADVGGRKLLQELTSGCSYLSQGPFEAHFGLGSLPRADSLLVQWPSPRIRKSLPDRYVPAGRFRVESPAEP